VIVAGKIPTEFTEPCEMTSKHRVHDSLRKKHKSTSNIISRKNIRSSKSVLILPIFAFRDFQNFRNLFCYKLVNDFAVSLVSNVAAIASSGLFSFDFCSFANDVESFHRK
jgi:hypothetical protein